MSAPAEQYGDWLIYADRPPVPGVNYSFHHKDYDGTEDANDHRCGFSCTLEQAKAEIDAIIELEADLAEAA